MSDSDIVAGVIVSLIGLIISVYFWIWICRKCHERDEQMLQITRELNTLRNERNTTPNPYTPNPYTPNLYTPSMV